MVDFELFEITPSDTRSHQNVPKPFFGMQVYGLPPPTYYNLKINRTSVRNGKDDRIRINRSKGSANKRSHWVLRQSATYPLTHFWVSDVIKVNPMKLGSGYELPARPQCHRRHALSSASSRIHKTP